MQNEIALSTSNTALAATGKKTYDMAAKQFASWLGERPITEATLREYFRELEQTRRPATVNLYKAAIKASLKRAAGRNASAHALAALDELFRDIKSAKIDYSVHEDETLKKSEVLKLAKKAPPRIGALAAFLFASGLRISEALNIRLDDIAEAGETCKIRVLGKGKKERVVFVDKATVQRVEKAFASKTWLFENKRGSKYSRQYFDRELRKAAAKILGKVFGCHTLRHSHATALIQAGESLKAVSRNLGHADPGFTAKCYVHDTVSESAILALGV